MLPRSSPLLLVATAVGLLAVHSCIMLGGAMREAAVAFCAVALLIGAPIAILAWLGSLPDRDEKLRQQQRNLKKQQSEALLWQATLLELQPPAPSGSATSRAGEEAFARVASAPANWLGRRRRPILALCVTVASTLGLMGCYGGPTPNWAAVHPGMGTPELVSLVGAPEQIKSNGTAELWQYCRDFFGRNADYYMAVLIDSDQVKDVRPYPVLSNAGCEDFYRTGF